MTMLGSSLNPQIVGHDETLSQVQRSLQSSRLHHAWLIAGLEGIGKSTLAHHIAAHLLSGGENEIGKINLQHRVTKLIAAETHPDMLVIRRSVDEKTGEPRQNIAVEDVLKIAAFLHKTSTHGGWRVVIIDEAHCLNRFGQNAVLKILEEPPPRTLILMTVTTPGALLPTIRSRCRVLFLAPLDDRSFKTILVKNAPQLSDEDVVRLIKLSGGSVGFALKILRTEVLEIFAEIETMLRAPTPLDTARLHKIADKISPKAESESYEVLSTLLVDRLGQRVRSEAVQANAASHVPVHLNLWDKVRHNFVQGDRANLDRKLTFLHAVRDIKHSQVEWP